MNNLASIKSLTMSQRISEGRRAEVVSSDRDFISAIVLSNNLELYISLLSAAQ